MATWTHVLSHREFLVISTRGICRLRLAIAHRFSQVCDAFAMGESRQILRFVTDSRIPERIRTASHDSRRIPE
eukprot:5353625-Prymnesium_polylepis.1